MNGALVNKHRGLKQALHYEISSVWLFRRVDEIFLVIPHWNSGESLCLLAVVAVADRLQAAD